MNGERAAHPSWRAKEQIRIAAALAHAIPGVTLEVRCRSDVRDDERLLVAHHRLDAHLDPCQFRRVLLAGSTTGLPAVAARIDRVELRCGVDDLGAGVYGRTGDDGPERWFATTLLPDAVNEVFDACDLDIAHEAIGARILPDSCLGVTVVCLTANDVWHRYRLDEVAAWSVAACMVEELVGQPQLR